jgi:flagellar hook-associated protein 2
MTTIDKTGGQASAIMKSLNVGSGVDVDALARNLANAENSARINTINERKASVESRLSGYAIVSSFLSDIKSDFDALKNVSALFQTSATSADPTRVAVSLTGDAKPGQYGIEIQQLARGSVFQSSGFADKDISLNAGASFGVQITRADGSVLNVDVTGNDTPAGMVAAINAADVGINAALINKSANGNDWHIVLQGEHGAANDFSITTTAATDMGFDQGSNKLVAAQDAIINVNGLVGITRGSNLITDVIAGASIDLKSEPGQLVTIRIERSGAPMREQVLRLADSYNQMNVVLDELTSASADDEFTGALRRDMQFVNSLRQQLRDLLTQPSSTPSGGISSLRDVGLSFTLSGKAEVDLGRLDIALASNADAIATMLSGGTDNTSDFASGPKGLAQDASILLKGLLGPQGLINQRKTSGTSQISVYERDLVAIEARLEATYSRYILQFAAMESLVERMQGIGDYLKGQFTAMENMYKN